MVEFSNDHVCLAKNQVNEESKEEMNNLNRKKNKIENKSMPQKKNMSFKGRGKGYIC